MRLPQPGDAVKATRVMNGRMEAAVGATDPRELVTAGEVVLADDGITGPGAQALFAIYGDLFDITETLNEAGFARMLLNHEREVEGGEERLDAALVAVALQGVGFGVLMERLRWERGS